MNCGQNGCSKLPLVRIFWPGKDPAPVYCLEHSIMAKTILNHLGVPAVVEALTVEDALKDYVGE